MTNLTPLSFRIDVSYSQIAVFSAGLQAPFSDWTQAHVEQGFAWRQDSVSFKCLREVGTADVSVAVTRNFLLHENTVRSIQVPFSVPPAGQLEIASISDGAQIEIPGGHYLLVFETGISPAGEMWCRFSFVEGNEGAFAILRADAGLQPPENLVLTVAPA